MENNGFKQSTSLKFELNQVKNKITPQISNEDFANVLISYIANDLQVDKSIVFEKLNFFYSELNRK
jgi:hypothetical protein